MEDAGADIAEEFTEEVRGETGPAFDKACHAAARLGAKLVIASVGRGRGPPDLQLAIPVLQEEYTMSTGGPLTASIELVLAGPFLQSRPSIGGRLALCYSWEATAAASEDLAAQAVLNLADRTINEAEFAAFIRDNLA